MNFYFTIKYFFVNKIISLNELKFCCFLKYANLIHQSKQNFKYSPKLSYLIKVFIVFKVKIL
ncbi:hypothetical protein BA918_03470 [Helicobacter pullorum]|nr:hypothetical protein BA918_03470 [Helicobacter pullorum]